MERGGVVAMLAAKAKIEDEKGSFLLLLLLLRRVSRSVVGCAKRTRPEEMEPHLSMQSDPYVNWEKKGAH